VIGDVKLLESKTWVLWRDEVSPMLGPLFVEEEAPLEQVQAEGMSLSFLSGPSMNSNRLIQMPYEQFCRA
jgi:hypothetical protein